MTDWREYNRQLIESFRTAREDGKELEDDRPLVLITTTGARSGKRRTTPLVYIPHEERLLIVASNGGSPKHPDWYYNLVADPAVTVEVGMEIFNTTAHVLDEDERNAVWPLIVGTHAFFGKYQDQVSRQIPVIALPHR